MGLDSGILICSNRRAITREMLPEELIYAFDRDYDEGFPEINYHRKDWGLRNAIIDYFGGENHIGGYEIETSSQVFDIIRITVSFMDKEKWENEGESIWDYDEVLPRLQQDIINLAIMAAFMKNNPDVYLVFYDSY